MKIQSAVLAIIDQSAVSGCQLVLPSQLDRDVYMRVAKIIEAVGGKWNRKAKAHLFEGDAGEAIEPLLLTGEVTFRKQEFGQFYTPAAIAQMVIMAALVKPGDIVLEPSAGRGDIAGAAVVAGAAVDCVEIDPKNHAFLLEDRRYGVVRCGDFLDITPVGEYSAVVMNPPFAGQADIRHVMHASRFLMDGGRLAAIMSAGVLFRQNKLTTDFRAFVDGRGGSIEPLPDNAFKESGTNVNTVLVTI